jgi:hypothetical protein
VTHSPEKLAPPLNRLTAEARLGAGALGAALVPAGALWLVLVGGLGAGCETDCGADVVAVAWTLAKLGSATMIVAGLLAVLTALSGNRFLGRWTAWLIAFSMAALAAEVALFAAW